MQSFIWLKFFAMFVNCHVKNLNQCNVIDPTFVEKVLQSLHVDDFISGTETIEEACLAEGGFN